MSQTALSDDLPTASLPALEDFLCFAAYSANLAFGRAYKPFLNQLGLTYTQWITLVALSEEDGQTVSQLGKRVFLASNTLTPLLKQLEQQGFVKRERAKEDERQVIVRLTEAGWAKRNESRICAGIFQHTGLTREEARALQKALVKLRENLLEAEQVRR
ncbi:MarR family transcriptional regulator [Neisseria bacilliformis]|jgi:transcriptional regulator, MarR family|uniref:MarR family winged helix-turn-helix transcriptional regulator n=1 Tax=Neisseria bacilliformis TaxID=267212 RepID=UPI0028EF100F|nr:MarR family transcriptional regulator [Neisseria bacilliformis]